MIFTKVANEIQINNKKFTLEEFQALEPDYQCDYVLEYFGPQGHWLSNGPGFERVSGESINAPSRQVYIDRAIAGAYDPPDWSGFRLALMGSASFNAWAEALSPTLRENLKIAAVVENLQAVQDVYDAAIVNSPPAEQFRESWQVLANQYRIPLSL